MAEEYTIRFEEAAPEVLGTRFWQPHYKYAQAVAERFAASPIELAYLRNIPEFGCTRATLIDALRQACEPRGIKVHKREENIILRKER